MTRKDLETGTRAKTVRISAERYEVYKAAAYELDVTVNQFLLIAADEWCRRREAARPET